MCTNGTQIPCEGCHPNPIPQPVKVGHTTGVYNPFSNGDVGSFSSHKSKSVKVLWDGTYGFLSLFEKTTKSNHLQMSLQRQQFLLSYFKTTSVGPAVVWTPQTPTRQTGTLSTELTRQQFVTWLTCMSFLALWHSHSSSQIEKEEATIFQVSIIIIIYLSQFFKQTRWLSSYII